MTGALALKPIPLKAGIGDKFSEQRQEYLSLFPNRTRHIQKKPGCKEWTTVKGPLFTGLIDAALSGESETFYGAHWGPQTQFAVLDIDAGSNYHNVQELKHLRQRLASVGLAGTALFQSSNSGGWHLYIPVEEPEASKEVEQALKAWLKLQGYELRGGQLEVFPCGNGLRLPLQSGFAWLNENAELIISRGQLTTEAALDRFLFDLERAANNWNDAKTLIETQIAAMTAAAAKQNQARQERLETGGFEHLYSAGRIQMHWEKGRKFWQEGLASRGQRHDAVLFVGHYLWYGDAENGIAALPGARNDEYRARLIEQWLTDKHNGFCRHIDQDKWEEVKAQIKRAALWRGDGQAREYEPYRLTDRLIKRLLAIFRKTGKVWTVEDFKQANDDRQEEARCKIRAAVAQCLEEGRQVSRSTLETLTGCSPNTLKKHADLWRLFAIGSGEYNRGGSGGLAALGAAGSDTSHINTKSSPKLLGSSGAATIREKLGHLPELTAGKDSCEKPNGFMTSVEPDSSGKNYGLSSNGTRSGAKQESLDSSGIAVENLEPAAGLDSLRYDSSRADGEELKAREAEDLPAVNPNQSN
ncbi:MAG: hypothetical protein K2X29_12505, partial [Candidatus Obscuribacterales bacterium]|nr:hypothetical protein [Candidatus Obscuribacterales bacterium]